MVLFYRKQSEKGKRVKRLVEKALSAGCVEVCHTIEEMSGRLRHPDHPSMIILLAENREAVNRLCALRELMNDAGIVLLLPDSGKDTVAMGLKLFPRYIGYLNEDLSNLSPVLKKMATLKNRSAECQTEGVS